MELDFLSVSEVSGVSQAGDDVVVAGEFFVYGGNPQGVAVIQPLEQLVYGVAAGYGTHQMDAGGLTAGFFQLLHITLFSASYRRYER